jgi:glucose/arabinose dehydrogenase
MRDLPLERADDPRSELAWMVAVLNLGAHVAPLGMKFYTGDQFPAEYKNSILIAEHGSWNRHKYQGARIMRVTAAVRTSRRSRINRWPVN